MPILYFALLLPSLFPPPSSLHLGIRSAYRGSNPIINPRLSFALHGGFLSLLWYNVRTKLVNVVCIRQKR